MILGGFTLRFESTGKLAELVLPGGASILHTAGPHSFPAGNGREYVVGGWDECFPTIEPHGNSPVMGDLISLTPTLRELPDRVEQTWATPQYRATRTFRASHDRELELTFQVTNRGAVPLEFLWASHALFATARLRSVALPDGTRLDDFSFNGTCRKFFIPATGPVTLGGVILITDQPFWGIWLNRGGWPDTNPARFGCLGIEATTTATEAPGGRMLLPGGEFCGYVTLQTGGPKHAKI